MNKCAEMNKKSEHNWRTSGELLSNYRRVVGFVSSKLRFSEASLSLIEGTWGDGERSGGGCSNGGGLGFMWSHFYGMNDVERWGLGGGWSERRDVGQEWKGCQTLRTALHTMSLHLQCSFYETHTWTLVSWNALGELNAPLALPIYPVFEDEKSNGSDGQSVKQKNCTKKTTGLI